MLGFFFITQSAFAQPCENIYNRSPAVLVHNCSGLKVVRLSGTPRDRAMAFGALVRNGTLSPDVLNYFGTKLERDLAGGLGWLAKPALLAYNQFVRVLHRNVPIPLAEEIDAMAEGMGVDPIVLRRGLSLADTGVLVHALGSRFRFLPAMGCTSVAAQLPDGSFAYGRNLDFAGVGLWDRNPMLLVVEPEAGSSELRHIVIGADGLLFGGITGANEAGITLAVHQNYTSEAGVVGQPLPLIGEFVLRKARTLDEAVDILRSLRPAVLWTFVLTDLRAEEAIAVESSPSHFLVRRQEGKLFVQTNHAMHEESRQIENASFGVKTNSIFRMKQAYELLESGLKSGRKSDLLASVLAQQEDPEGRFTAYHDILKGLTIQTALFTRGQNREIRLELSIDPSPTASGRFASFSLSDLWKNAEPSVEVTDPVRTSPAKRANQRAIAEAFRLYFDEHQYLKAAQLLESHRTFDAAVLRIVALYEEGRFAESALESDFALRDPHFLGEPIYVRQSVETLRLASLYQLGQKKEALSLAQDLEERYGATGISADRLALLVGTIARGKKPAAWMLDLEFDFFSGDLSGRKN